MHHSIIKFNKNKYKNPLQMDFLIIEETPKITISPEVSVTDFFEIMLLTQPVKGHVLLDEHSISLATPTILFISPFQKRRWFVDQKQLKGYTMIFEKDFFSGFFEDKMFVYQLQYFYTYSQAPFMPLAPLAEHWEHLFKELSQEIKDYKKDSDHLLRSILYYILIKINRNYTNYYKLPNNKKNNVAFCFKEAIEKHFYQKNHVNDYAQHLKVSRVTLNKACKEQFGVSANEIIKERILSEVKKRLIHTRQNIAEIAEDLSFSEPNNLTRFFKKRTGITPLAFKKRYQNDSF